MVPGTYPGSRKNILWPSANGEWPFFYLFILFEKDILCLVTHKTFVLIQSR